MKVFLAKKMGFCGGVKRAYEMIKNNYQQFPQPVQIFGDLVHNTYVVKEVNSWGIKKVRDYRKVKRGTLIITAHGINPQIKEELQKNGINVVDTTCPKVMKVIEIAKSFFDNGKHVLIFGDKNHAEVKAINGAIKEQGIVFNDLLELQRIFLQSNVCPDQLWGLISQTTRRQEEFQKVINFLEKKIGKDQLEVYPSICLAVKERQDEGVRLAKKCEIVLVIGSKNSANSCELFLLVHKHNPCSYFIDNALEIKGEWFKGKESVGICAGASIPENIIKEVDIRVRENG